MHDIVRTCTRYSISNSKCIHLLVFGVILIVRCLIVCAEPDNTDVPDSANTCTSQGDDSMITTEDSE